MDTESVKTPGRKDDQGKLQWSLLPIESVEQEIKVLMAGADRYGAYNWQLVDNAIERYTNAIFRHAAEIQKGNIFDEDGFRHSAHIACCAHFLEWLYIYNLRKATHETPEQRCGGTNANPKS